MDIKIIRMIIFLGIGAIILFPRITSALVINEIHFNPPSPIGDDDGEFVELFNEQDNSVNLTGYSIGGITVSLDGIILDGRGFLVLVSEILDDEGDGYNFESIHGNGDGSTDEFPFLLVDYSGSLTNGGETLIIFGPGGEIVESFNYLSFAGSPSDGGGFSVERIDPTIPAVDNNFGVSNILAGTPGGRNSIAVAYPSQSNSEVPEPATILLLLTGLAGLAGFRKRGPFCSPGRKS